jgi:hypothetical protein
MGRMWQDRRNIPQYRRNIQKERATILIRYVDGVSHTHVLLVLSYLININLHN